MEHGDDHLGSGESVPQGDSPKGPYIKYGCMDWRSCHATVTLYGRGRRTPSIINL